MKYRLSSILMFVIIAIHACKSKQELITESLPDKKEVLESKESVMVEESKYESMDVLAPSLEESVKATKVAYNRSAPNISATAMSAYVADGRMTLTTSSSVVFERYAASPEGGRISTSENMQQAAAGQLTAGEWNDLNKWEDWKELTADSIYGQMQAYWQIYPRFRYTVFVRNEQNFPIANAKAELLNASDEPIWIALSDNAGRAELWYELYSRQSDKSALRIRITTPQGVQYIDGPKSIENGVNQHVVRQVCPSQQEIQIMFVVDATGSMGDEIAYLQSELTDVIRRAKDQLNDRTLSIGSVFYRDHGDEYVTRTQDMSPEYQSTLNFIAEQRAEGGGDYPEAIEEALDEALDQQWSGTTVTRILFLLLDAPPHEDAKTMNRIKSQVAQASAMGIKIIPITASGINRQTEFLMKFMALATNGTYVFITDHSGIGGDHLEHIEPDYEVEKLNDILVRLILQYSQPNGCEHNTSEASTASPWTIYPNPASQVLTFSTKHTIARLIIVSNSGKIVYQQLNLAAGEYQIPLSGLIDGIYTLTTIIADAQHSQSLIVIHNG